MKRLGMIWLLAVAVLAMIRPAMGWQNAELPVRSRFIGVWKLVSFELKSMNGEVSYPYGERPVGRLTYDPAGRMSAQLMRSGRSRASGRTLRGASVDALREAVDSFIAYFGTYDINDTSRTVIHHVQACLIPSWVGTDLKRTYEFEGNRLILTAVSEDGVGRLVWEREPD